MKTEDVNNFFGSQKATAAALGLSPPAICQWGEEVPRSRQHHVRLAMKAEQDKRAKAAKRAAKKAEKEKKEMRESEPEQRAEVA